MAEEILVIEDDQYIQEVIAEYLKAQGYKMEMVSDRAEGYQMFKTRNFNLVLLDVMLKHHKSVQNTDDSGVSSESIQEIMQFAATIQNRVQIYLNE